MGARLLQFTNQFTAYSFYAIELKLGRMIPDTNPHYRSELFFFIFARGAMRPRILKSSNRFTAYSFDAIELKLGRMILDINLLNRYDQDFLGTGEVLSISKSFAFVHVLLTRRRRNLFLFVIPQFRCIGVQTYTGEE